MTVLTQPYPAGFTEAIINFSASGDTALVAAVAAQTTKIYRLFLVVAGATTLTFKDGSSALTGAMTMTSGGSLTLDFDGNPWFTGSANTAFNLNSGNAVQVSGRLYYIQSIPAQITRV